MEDMHKAAEDTNQIKQLEDKARRYEHRVFTVSHSNMLTKHTFAKKFLKNSQELQNSMSDVY